LIELFIFGGSPSNIAYNVSVYAKLPTFLFYIIENEKRSGNLSEEILRPFKCKISEPHTPCYVL